MRFGLVGTGFWARTAHAPAIASTPGSTLDAVWGRNIRSASELAAGYGAVPYADPGDFLAAVDAVTFAVPPHVQAPIAIRAAEAGKHLLLEKPIALSLTDADKLVQAVESSNVATVVFFTLRFNTEIRAWLADENARGGWSGGGWSGGVAVWLGDALRPDSPFNTPWRREKGGLWDLGPHVVSMLWACLGPVTSVSAVPGGQDVTHLVLRHEGGAGSTATITMRAPAAAAGNNLFVWGEAGRSVMPSAPVDPVPALRVAATELAALAAASGCREHPCDVRFGREVVRVLAAAQERLSLHPERLHKLAPSASPSTTFRRPAARRLIGLAAPSTVATCTWMPVFSYALPMDSRPAVPDPGNLRASDQDRERVAETLREAAGEGRLSLEELDQRLDAVYAAKTYAELEPITRDLPSAGTAQPPAPAPGPAPDPQRFGGEPGSSVGIAIMGGFTRKGDWVVPREFSAFTLMGGGEIDMREARFAEPAVTIHAVTIMGGIEITVPEDANVRVTGIGIMGSFDHKASGGGQPGGPTITVDGVALMGGVDVKRRPPRKSKRDKLQAKMDAKLEKLERKAREIE